MPDTFDDAILIDGLVIARFSRAIFEDMRKACEPEDLEPVQFIEDRKRAISIAMDTATTGDCVLIAGKGHETFQEFDGRVVPFDDRQVARDMIRLKELARR